MSKKFAVLCAVVIATIAFAKWRMDSGAGDSAWLSKMERHPSAVPYDGEKRIAGALAIARKTGKHVLIQSTAYGCSWCHVLNKLLTTNPELIAKVEKDYVYAIVDTTNDQERSFYKKYASATDHTLVLVVLDADGKELTQSIGFDIVQDDPQHPGEYHIAPAHIMAFLNDWSPKG